MAVCLFICTIWGSWRLQAWQKQRKQRQRTREAARSPAAPRHGHGRLRRSAHGSWKYMRPIVFGVCGLLAFRRWAGILRHGLPAAVIHPQQLGRRLKTDRWGMGKLDNGRIA